MLDALPRSRFNDIKLTAAKHRRSISGHKYEVSICRNPIYLQMTGSTLRIHFAISTNIQKKTVRVLLRQAYHSLFRNDVDSVKCLLVSPMKLKSSEISPYQKTDQGIRKFSSFPSDE